MFRILLLLLISSILVAGCSQNPKPTNTSDWYEIDTLNIYGTYLPIDTSWKVLMKRESKGFSHLGRIQQDEKTVFRFIIDMPLITDTTTVYRTIISDTLDDLVITWAEGDKHNQIIELKELKEHGVYYFFGSLNPDFNNEKEKLTEFFFELKKNVFYEQIRRDKYVWKRYWREKLEGKNQ